MFELCEVRANKGDSARSHIVSLIKASKYGRLRVLASLILPFSPTIWLTSSRTFVNMSGLNNDSDQNILALQPK